MKRGERLASCAKVRRCQGCAAGLALLKGDGARKPLTVVQALPYHVSDARLVQIDHEGAAAADGVHLALMLHRHLLQEGDERLVQRAAIFPLPARFAQSANGELGHAIPTDPDPFRRFGERQSMAS